MAQEVFVTGVSGCVGHYLFDELAADDRYHLHLLVRDPARLRFSPFGRPNVTVHTGDLLDLERHAEVIGRMDHLIHVAAAWGEAISYEVNYRLAHRLFALADPARVRRLVYFGTASVLDSENRLLPAAEVHGTDYIKSKYLCVRDWPQHPLYDRIVTVCPTLIFGGSPRHPVSHLSSGLPGLGRWLAIARHLSLDGSLHVIHARDIARIVHHLLDHEPTDRLLVLGNDPMTVDELIDELCEAFGRTRGARFDLTPHLGLIERLAGSRMNTWDRYSLRHRHFRYRAVGPGAFGLPTDLSTVSAIVRERLAV
jgi:nucleoside-diphosphate-sugar epimerase